MASPRKSGHKDRPPRKTASRIQPSRKTTRQIQLQARSVLDLPPELRLIIHRLVLADYENDKASIKEALLSCKQMKAELDDEIPKDRIRKITPVIEDFAKAWNKEYFLFQTTTTVQIEGVKVGDEEREDTPAR